MIKIREYEEDRVARVLTETAFIQIHDAGRGSLNIQVNGEVVGSLYSLQVRDIDGLIEALQIAKAAVQA